MSGDVTPPSTSTWNSTGPATGGAPEGPRRLDGFVPPLEAWQQEPNLRWSMQHMADFLPVHQISSLGRTLALPSVPADLGHIDVPHPWEPRSAPFEDVMASTYTDGWIVARDGAVMGEQYLGTMSPGVLHLLMSVSKSLTTAVAGTLMGAGALDAGAQVTAYVPALIGSGYDGARVRDLLDMRTGVRFSEAYLDENAEVRLLEEAIGWAPRRHPDTPGTLRDFLATLGANGPHGGRFDYKSCETDALAFVIEGATGVHAADLMSERLWAPMGAEFGANVGVDAVGAGMFDGGVSASLRDLLRFGTLFLRDGAAMDGRQVLPPAWIAETVAGGPDSRAAFANAAEPTLMPGGMYRNGFWFPYPGSDVFLALGIHGQMVYVNRAAGVVAAKLSSWPTPQDAERLLWTVKAFDAVARTIA
ncbi:MAG: beta-lactamase family protein [Microbacterium sp.]|jgi:CubicO group peptidase (beta-lactamase class C family)|uniref:serine hydrolase domain-containing protein n=1 Tax=Microbacterium sp. TaxID=51671 RepID=UPI002825EAFE|nr:serine hydrolase [Microbacterium sp.]MDR2322072.1 beta-lactamase family protein [Microbacterium sp.]